jgi:PST family polysaccharide transporter
MSSVPSNAPIAVTPVVPPAEKNTYGQIVKSSALIGGSSVVNIGVGIIRTKAMALLLGPTGFGLMGLYSSIADLTQSVAGMGLNSSGVRQIAEAAGSRDAARIARTTTVLRRVSILLGLLGAVVLLIFCRPISRWTFQTDAHAGAVALLSLVVWFRTVSNGQGALIQGMRRIADLAKANILAAVLGTAIAIVLVYFLRETGLVPSLIVVALMSLAVEWWYSHRLGIKSVPMTFAEVRHEAGALLKLGMAFMASGLMIMGSAYLIRTILLHQLGVAATGLYQSAWTLGGLYIGFILQAMGADFYPRLTASATDDRECNRLVNEQTEISLLMAAPGVLATLTFAPLVMVLFYTKDFSAAVGTLRWICLGMVMRVVSWPMGYIILAKGRQVILFLVDGAWTLVHLGLAWFCVKKFGVDGGGMAFFGSYVFHTVVCYFVARHLSGFRWSPANRRLGVLAVLLAGAIFLAFRLFSETVATALAAVATVASGVYSIRAIVNLVSLDRLPRLLRRILERFGLAPSRKQP